jgi:hypothetical protein
MRDLQHAHRLYLHPGGAWDGEPEGATLRIDARARVRASAESRNQLYRPDGKGGWEAVTDESALSAGERGLVWFGWPTMVRGHAYLAFKGVRVVDEDVAALVRGLSVFDEEGSALEAPQEAGHLFLLEPADARAFHKRVKEAGGEVRRGDPVAPSAHERLEALSGATSRMEASGEQDKAFVVEAEGGDFSGQPSFERRHKEQHDALSQGRAAYHDIESAVRPLLDAGRSLEERSQAESIMSSADAHITSCEALWEAREGHERRLGRLLGHEVEGADSAHSALLCREIGRLAQEAGHEVEEVRGGVRIKLGGGVLELGPGFRFSQ